MCASRGWRQTEPGRQAQQGGRRAEAAAAAPELCRATVAAMAASGRRAGLDAPPSVTCAGLYCRTVPLPHHHTPTAPSYAPLMTPPAVAASTRTASTCPSALRTHCQEARSQNLQGQRSSSSSGGGQQAGVQQQQQRGACKKERGTCKKGIWDTPHGTT